MNKRRKILTLVALAVFGAIMFFHYYSFDYKPPYEQTYLIPKSASEFLDEGKFDPDAYLAQPKPTPKERMTAAEFYKISLEDRANAPHVPNQLVIVKIFPQSAIYLRRGK